MSNLEKITLKYLDYFEDLRKRLHRGIILFGLIFIIGFFSSGPILKGLLQLIKLADVSIITSSPFQFTNIAMDIGFFFAIIITTPYLIYSFYSFISPALTGRERVKLLQSVPLSIGLFIAGFTYGFMVLYYALELLARVNKNLGIVNLWDISQFLSQIFLTAAILGLVFEFPIILTFLIRANFIGVQFLYNKRRLIYFLIFTIVSLLPPTDGISLVVMSLPLLLLYEVTILLNTK